MSEIIILPRPDSVGFDALHHVLWQANEGNRKEGFVLKTSELDGEALKARIGEGGQCFVVLDGNKPVGTISVKPLHRRRWYMSGDLAEYMLAAILPEYQGRGLLTRLAAQVFEWAEEHGYPAVELNTAENNAHAIAVYEHQGFRLVDYTAPSGADHYSVVMIKWLKGAPYPEIKRRAMYAYRRFWIRLRFRPGGKKRF